MDDGSRVSGLHDSAESDNRDRLSELPDSLILQILSWLPMTDVVTTTVLAQRWKDLWTTVPCLHFGSRTDDLEKFRSFVCGALAHWKGPKLLKFSMAFLFHESISSDLDSWLLFAMEKQVEELYINLSDSIFYIGIPQREYHFPQCPQLETRQVDSYVRSSRLKMLKIKRFLSDGSSDLVIQTVMRIWAPNLETLELSDWCIKVLLEMKEDMLEFPNAKYLKFKAIEAKDILDVVEMFPKLMMLIVELHDSVSDLFTCYLALDLNLGKEPTFITVGSEPKTIIRSASSMLRLKTVEISWHALDASIIPCLEFLLGNSLLLEKMVVRLRWHGANRELLYLAEEKVLSLPRSSPTAEVIIIKV